MRPLLTTARATPVRLRPFEAGDESFLYDLFADRRAPELRALGWPPAEQEAFVAMQFRAQQSGYAAAFPDAEHWVVGVDGERVGRLLVDQQEETDTVVDIVVLSRYRGLGIGTVLVVEVLADADAAGRPVRLTVVAHDPRLIRWYKRLGFVETEDNGLHVTMEHRPTRMQGA